MRFVLSGYKQTRWYLSKTEYRKIMLLFDAEIILFNHIFLYNMLLF